MEILIRKGRKEDTEAFIQLLQEVREEMEQKEWFYLDPPEFVREAMDKGTMQLWVAMDGEQMAGAFDLLIPGLEEYNYGYDLGFSQEELLQVVNMDTAAVHPKYRGLKLQHRLLSAAEEEIRSWGKRILLCTIHPENKYSLNNATALGYEVQSVLDMYGSVRCILRKDIL